MKIARTICAALSLCAVLTTQQSVCGQGASGPEQGGPYGTMELRDVTVIDGSGAPAFGPVNVYIKGNRIERIAGTDAISRNRAGGGEAGNAKAEKQPDRVIEGKGMFVMPGL